VAGKCIVYFTILRSVWSGRLFLQVHFFGSSKLGGQLGESTSVEPPLHIGLVFCSVNTIV